MRICVCAGTRACVYVCLSASVLCLCVFECERSYLCACVGLGIGVDIYNLITIYIRVFIAVQVHL